MPFRSGMGFSYKTIYGRINNEKNQIKYPVDFSRYRLGRLVVLLKGVVYRTNGPGNALINMRAVQQMFQPEFVNRFVFQKLPSCPCPVLFKK